MASKVRGELAGQSLSKMGGKAIRTCAKGNARSIYAQYGRKALHNVGGEDFLRFQEGFVGVEALFGGEAQGARQLKRLLAKDAGYASGSQRGGA